MAANGRLPASELTDIPGGRLDKQAAGAWLAMRAQIASREGVWITPAGPSSSYRTYGQQQRFWNEYQAGRGATAAKPGTSNHGWGRAVDVKTHTMAEAIRRHGPDFGWSSAEGDRVNEWWHRTFIGPYDGPVPDSDPHPTLRKGSTGDAVRRAQTLMRDMGVSIAVTGTWSDADVSAARRLYSRYGHQPRAHFGDTGWLIVEGKHPWRVLTKEERAKAALLYAKRRMALRAGGWEKLADSHRRSADRAEDWLLARRKLIWRLAEGKVAGEHAGWDVQERGRRYARLKEITTA